jgi:hypothetical protein
MERGETIWHKNPDQYSGELVVCPNYRDKGEHINRLLKPYKDWGGVVPYLPQGEEYDQLDNWKRLEALCAAVSFFIDHRLSLNWFYFYPMPRPAYSGYITIHLRSKADEAGCSVPPMTPILSGYWGLTEEERNAAWCHQAAWAYRNNCIRYLSYPVCQFSPEDWEKG